jgi:hypothetical protein
VPIALYRNPPPTLPPTQNNSTNGSPEQGKRWAKNSAQIDTPVRKFTLAERSFFFSGGHHEKFLIVLSGAAIGHDFRNNIRIKDRQLFVRDLDARTLLKEAIDQLRTRPRSNPLATEPIIVPRTDKLPVTVRIWRFDRPAQRVRVHDVK